MASQFSIDGSKAFQIALEDPHMIFFIKANFSHPEERPQIISRKWLSKGNFGYKWNVEIIEKNSLFSRKKVQMINVALIEIDSSSGQIIKRRFFRNIFFEEYRKIVAQSNSPN